MKKRLYLLLYKFVSVICLLICLPVYVYAQQTNSLILAENHKPGTKEWMLTKVDTVRTFIKDQKSAPPYYARSKRIEGFVSKTSYAAGDTVHVYVNTEPISTFKLEVFRMGYYQGNGGRRMLSVENIKGIAQPTPEDGKRNLRESVWQRSHSFTIPSEWVSGVYLGKLTENNTGYQAYIVFVVKDKRKADFMFQVSDLTWQAYNRWPAWRSLYDFQDNIWNTSGGNILSFDRPYTFYYNGLPSNLNLYTNGSGEFLLWEFPLAFWMEREGYDVTYVSNLDTHQDAQGLLRVKGFISVGHDEYWTRQMHMNVSHARDQGINLLFLGGNSVDGEIFLTTSSDGRPDRIMGRIRDFPDEQNLMGASSYGVGLGNWTVKQADHWLFEKTGLKNGDAISDLVGWEYQGPPLRNDPSLIVLAQSKMDDKWKPDPDNYTTTIYNGPKGNFVFNAATCWWSMPLSSPPSFRNPPGKDFTKEDVRVQQMTRNLLNRARSVQAGK
ncbi:hypothetical protein GXP67_16790 [Rhodocytophaga rosea]|uniref:N,N-dimethylformamidase beta subunit-like C-terminal domain-containing protein n=1 Tax=Rhodocytophaga rosea TaxID=2704465 RepID=A0A6C0GKM0_9BACT|nr:N,N-dimethylformamidase beta subunit family domain-containing protein [Rhodocytophaga rosea]QHT68180.1 hypothetical protein GXP67_16790 [Rhodocytophaga rosea]